MAGNFEIDPAQAEEGLACAAQHCEEIEAVVQDADS
jgi:hypothetical protein